MGHYEIVQVTKKGKRVCIVRDTVSDISAAELKRSMFAGTEHEQFVIREL